MYHQWKYVSFLTIALFTLLGCDSERQTTISDDLAAWKRDLPEERRARNELFDWDAFLREMRDARDQKKLIPDEEELQRSYTNYDKGLAMRYPSEDDRAAPAIVGFHRELEKIGVHLLVVWVPNPIDLAAPRLSDSAVPKNLSIQPELTELFIDLTEAGVELLDLRPQFRTATDSEATDPFERWDHHWSSAGAGLAAKLVAERLSRYDIQGQREGAFDRRLRTIPKDVSSEDFLPSGFDPGTQDVVEILYRGEPLGSTPGGPVLVLGDSMISHLSKGKPHGVSADFTARLSAELGVPLSWQNRNGGAQLAPVDFIRDHLARDEPLPKVVVWVLSGNFFRSGSWPIVNFPTGEALDSLKAQHRATGTDAFVAIVNGGRSDSPVLSLTELPSTSDYPDVAVASQLIIGASQDEAAPTSGTEAVIYQWVMKDRKLIPEVPLSPSGATWMWLVPLDPSNPVEARILRDEEYPIELPRYWRVE